MLEKESPPAKKFPHHSKDKSLHEVQEAHKSRLWGKPLVTSRTLSFGFSVKDQKFLNEIAELTGLRPEDIFIKGLHFYGTAIKAALRCLSKNDFAEYKEEKVEEHQDDDKENRGNETGSSS